MKTVRIRSIRHLIGALNGQPNQCVYRGQADADWLLESGLERLLRANWSPQNAKRMEEYSINLFRSKFHLYDRQNATPASKLAWLSIMQHHGVPTRLLDFTESPYVALYFAIEAYDPAGRRDLAVFAIDYSALMEQSIAFIAERDPGFRETRQSVHEKQDQIFDEVVDANAYDVAWVAEPRVFNSRLDRQAGSFLITGNRGMRIEDLLNSPPYANVGITKYRIPAQFYTALFALLRKMNITSKSLYGDLDGLARWIGLEMRAYSTD